MAGENRDQSWPGPLDASTQVGIGLVTVSLGVSLVRYPAALTGDGLTYLAAVVIGLTVFEVLALSAYSRRTGWLAGALVIGAQGGLALGVLEIVNISLEDFGRLPPGLQAAMGAGMWGLMFLLFGAAGSRAAARSHSLIQSAVAGVWTAIVGTTITLLYGAALPLLAMPALVQLTDHGATSPQAQAVTNTLSSAAMHLVLAPALALAFALGGGAAALLVARLRRGTRFVVAASLPLVLAAGITALVWANNLPRAERPPFVMGGLAALGLSLATSHAIWSNPRFSGTSTGPEFSPPGPPRHLV